MPNPLFFNLFPDLLMSGVAILILRAVAGLIFIDLGILKFRGERLRWISSFETLNLRPADLLLPLYATLQIVCGALLFIGLWTQIAALILVVAAGIELYVEWKARDILKRDLVFYILIFAIVLSLFFSGAGKYGFDIPL